MNISYIQNVSMQTKKKRLCARTTHTTQQLQVKKKKNRVAKVNAYPSKKIACIQWTESKKKNVI